ncbi:MAG TPA: hypothetical protein VJ773_06315 [Gemmatimonadales bacterium]|nr:hypothetical protein [Gemmatimonadales bacterium]
MADERTEISAPDLARWAVVGVVFLAALGAYFALAPRTPPVLAPPAAGPVR